jgi:hypothetical protein
MPSCASFCNFEFSVELEADVVFAFNRPVKDKDIVHLYDVMVVSSKRNRIG